MGRIPNHDHTLLARSKLVPRDHAFSNRATKMVQAISVAPMECNNQRNNSKCHENYPVDCLEAHITICAWNGIREEISRMVTDSGQKEPSRTTSGYLNSGLLSAIRGHYQSLEICVSNLVEYFDYLQVTHDYAYTTLCMHASAICSILQPTDRQGPQ